MATWNEKRTQLIDDGFCVCEQVLSAEMLEQIRSVSTQLLDKQAAEHFERGFL